MDFSGYKEFPFPSNLNGDGIRAKEYFYSLSDGEQLKLLNGSKSYDEFQNRVISCIKAK
jgi:hypothetical protein